MKKNVMMRLAAILLVCVLASTCGISGTYAKYVTSDFAEDSARVAKWGVTVTAAGTLFSKSYKDLPVTSAVDTDGTITVQVVDWNTGNTNVVAPGTKNETGMSFVLTGTPEVDVNVQFKFEVVGDKEIKLAAGDYADDPTTGKLDDPFTVNEDYYPVVFVLKKDGNTLVSGNVATIQAWLNTYLNGIYQTNTDLSDINCAGDGNYRLTWYWDFDDSGAGTYDVKDTYLGNAIAGGSFPTKGATTDIEVKFTITVTQVD